MFFHVVIVSTTLSWAASAAAAAAAASARRSSPSFVHTRRQTIPIAPALDYKRQRLERPNPRKIISHRVCQRGSDNNAVVVDRKSSSQDSGSDAGGRGSGGGITSRRDACAGIASLAGMMSAALSRKMESDDVVASGGAAASGSVVALLPSPSAPFRVSMMIQIDKDQEGRIMVEIHPEWATLVSKRFVNLLKAGFSEEARFFRVLPGYMAQFGIAGERDLNIEWMLERAKAMSDETRKVSNKRGTMSFASSGKNTRQTQIFINLNDNDGPPKFLDAQGFFPFTRVVEGMDEVVTKLYSGYGLLESASAGMAGSVNQGKAAYYGNEYLNTVFPKLSYIQTARIM